MYSVRMIEDRHFGEHTDIFVTISRLDALQLIKSLVDQMAADSPNVGRVEPRYDREDHSGYGFISIAVRNDSDTAAKNALGVITKDPKIREWLVKNDPMALRQCEQALKNGG